MPQNLTINSLVPFLENNLVINTNATFIGIDFGTSTTVVSMAYWEGKTIKVEPLRLNQKLKEGGIETSDLVPTVIAYLGGNNLLIGKGAADLKFELKKGKNVWYSFKMELGEDIGDKYFESELGFENPTKRVITRPKDATKLFFSYLKQQIGKIIKEKKLSENIQYSVSIPASFEANQRKDLIDILTQNEMQISRQALIDEPNSAFLSYVKQSEIDENPLKIPDSYNPKVLVFDFGAGTCDVSILEISQSINGLRSKNLSISEFKKLGGDDIDRYIAVTYLFPQLLKANGLSINHFRSQEINEGIIPRLLKASEQIKISVCKNVGLAMAGRVLPELAQSEEFIAVGLTIEVDTSKGVLRLEKPKISYEGFKEAMEVFLKPYSPHPVKKLKGQADFISIFNPIQSALKKANLMKEQIDYVLFIGGSSKNPYVQVALKDYFKDSELLIPANLQKHVSIGAAIHSLVYNVLGKNIIQPITSEPIILVTKDETPRIIIKAGEEVPTNLIVVEDLETIEDEQSEIHLPICVGSLNKLLFNLRIYDSQKFTKYTRVKLELELNADKLLLVKATANDKQVMAEPLSPFANRELTTQERIVIKAEKQLNIRAAQNGGRQLKEDLLSVYRAYEQVENELMAAETLEKIYEMFPGSVSLNQIAIHYGNTGNREKSIEYYEKALENDPNNATIMFNISYALKKINKEKSENYLRKAYELSPNDPVIIFEMAKLKKENKEIDYEELLEKAYEIYNRKYEDNKMRDVEFGWFASVCDVLNRHSKANEIRNAKPKIENDKLWEDKYLAKSVFNESSSLPF